MIRVRKKATGQTGFLPEENFNPELYDLLESPQTSQQPVQQPQQQGLIGNLISPFVRTGERVAGAGETLLRKWMADKAEEALRRGDYDEAQRLGQAGGAPSRLTEDEGYRKSLTGALPIAKDTAAIGSWGVPVGKFAKPWVGGAISGAASGFGYSKGETPEELLTSTAVGAGTGAATAAILNKLFPGGSKGTVAETGRSLRESAINPQVKAGPQKFSKVQEIVDFADELGLKGTPKSMMKQINSIYDDLASKKDAILNSSNKTVQYGEFVNQIYDGMLSKGGAFTGTEAERNIIEHQLKLLAKQMDPSGNISAKAISQFKSSLPSGGFKNIAKLVDMTPKQALYVDLWHATDELLTNLEPAVKQTTLQQSKLYSLAPGIDKLSSEGIKSFGLNIKEPVQAFRGVENKLSDFLRGAGGGKPALDTVAGKIPAVLPAISSGGGGEVPEIPELTSVTEKTGAQESMLGLSKEDIGLLSMLPVKTQASIMEKIISEKILSKTSTKEKSVDQRTRESLNSTVKQARTLLKSGGISTGLILGNLESLKSKANMGDPRTVLFNTLIGNIRATAAKARGGTTFTANEERLLNQYIPKAGDSYQELMNKLTVLETIGI